MAEARYDDGDEDFSNAVITRRNSAGQCFSFTRQQFQFISLIRDDEQATVANIIVNFIELPLNLSYFVFAFATLFLLFVNTDIQDKKIEQYQKYIFKFL